MKEGVSYPPVEEEIFPPFPQELFDLYRPFGEKVYPFVWTPEENPHQNGGVFRYQVEAVKKIEEWLEEEGGKIILVLGPMMAGKSTVLAMLGNNLKGIMAVKHSLDEERVAGKRIINHPGSWETKAGSYFSARDLEEINFRGTLLVDEIQFIEAGEGASESEDNKLVSFLEARRNQGWSTVLFGLDTDFRRQPWPVVPHLLSVADEVVFLAPKCGIGGCQEVGWFTQRMVEEEGIWRPASTNDRLVVVGGKERYRPACEKHHAVLGKDLVQAGWRIEEGRFSAGGWARRGNFSEKGN